MQKDVAVDPYHVPESELIEEEKTGSLLIFNRFSAWYVFILSVLSLGLYSYFWLFVRSRTINIYTQNKVSEVLIYSTITLYFASIGIDIAYQFIDLPEKLVKINSMSMIPITIIHIIWLFSVRNRINDLLRERKTIGLHVSGFLTFFLGAIYLQYKINEGLDALNGELVIYDEKPNRNQVMDSDLIVDGIDFSDYKRSELQDSLMNIDREKHPERTRVIRMALERFKVV